jgi:PST family polysaccharide transporter
MTSLNAVVIGIRLVISFFIQRLLASLVGEAGMSKVGQVRNLTELLGSFATLGVFSGIVKYVAEHKNDKEQLLRLFSTTFVFSVLAISATSITLLIFAEHFSVLLFDSSEFVYLIRLFAVVVPAITLNRIFTGIVNGLSEYKKLAKIDLISYVLSSILTVGMLLSFNIDGALIAIAITPVIQLSVLLFIFFKVLREYVHFSKLTFRIPMAKGLLAFSLMSFFSTILMNYVEIDIRTMLIKRISESDAGIWTSMTFISKNYMVFAGSIFTLYVVPKFASIYNGLDFKKEVVNIYKTLLPLFGVGMIVVYLFRNILIDAIYPGFNEMAPLFKWQLMGDFIRLAALVLAHQFMAKKMVRNFIFSEVLSLGLFYGLAYYLSEIYGVEGVVMAHFIRYIIYFFVVLYLVFRYFRRGGGKSEVIE